MKCDECKEQVLELIEREAIDPEGVREVLAECPDCRAEFDRMKATLALAQQLPIEAPPDDVDALILQAAEARASEGKVVALPQRSVWSQPLAMAAIALLVVGIGVSTVSLVTRPEDERLAEATITEDDVGDLALPADRQRLDELESPSAPAVAEVSEEKVAIEQPHLAKPAASQKVRSAPARSPQKKKSREVARRASAPEVPEVEPEQLAEVEADATPDEHVARQQVDKAETGSSHYDAEEPPSVGAAAGKNMPALSKGSDATRDEAVDPKRRCASKVSKFEKRLAEQKDYAPTPEEQLDVGLCYQTLGKRSQARRWLNRAASHPSTSARAKEALRKLE